jgi:hypothetical protein
VAATISFDLVTAILIGLVVAGFELRSADRLGTRTISTAVAIRIPASAARGICATHPAATSTTTRSRSAWVRAARRDVAPDRTLTAVPAIAAVAGMPPNSGETSVSREAHSTDKDDDG